MDKGELRAQGIGRLSVARGRPVRAGPSPSLSGPVVAGCIVRGASQCQRQPRRDPGRTEAPAAAHPCMERIRAGPWGSATARRGRGCGPARSAGRAAPLLRLAAGPSGRSCPGRPVLAGPAHGFNRPAAWITSLRTCGGRRTAAPPGASSTWTPIPSSRAAQGRGSTWPVIKMLDRARAPSRAATIGRRAPPRAGPGSRRSRPTRSAPRRCRRRNAVGGRAGPGR